jgi:hypothetical protein
MTCRTRVVVLQPVLDDEVEAEAEIGNTQPRRPQARWQPAQLGLVLTERAFLQLCIGACTP